MVASKSMRIFDATYSVPPISMDHQRNPVSESIDDANSAPALAIADQNWDEGEDFESRSEQAQWPPAHNVNTGPRHRAFSALVFSVI